MPKGLELDTLAFNRLLDQLGLDAIFEIKRLDSQERSQPSVSGVTGDGTATMLATSAIPPEEVRTLQQGEEKYVVQLDFDSLWYKAGYSGAQGQAERFAASVESALLRGIHQVAVSEFVTDAERDAVHLLSYLGSLYVLAGGIHILESQSGQINQTEQLTLVMAMLFFIIALRVLVSTTYVVFRSTTNERYHSKLQYRMLEKQYMDDQDPNQAYTDVMSQEIWKECAVVPLLATVRRLAAFTQTGIDQNVRHTPLFRPTKR
jgi:hypothetical protein